MLAFQGNNALKLKQLNPPRFEQALRLQRDVYEGYLKRNGEEHPLTLRAATNLAVTRNDLKRYKEARSLLRKTIPVARRVLGEGHILTLTMRWTYATALFRDGNATLEDLREAVTTSEETTRTAQRVLGGSHPFTEDIEESLRESRETLAAREGDDVSPVCDGVAAMTAGDA